MDDGSQFHGELNSIWQVSYVVITQPNLASNPAETTPNSNLPSNFKENRCGSQERFMPEFDVVEMVFRLDLISPLIIPRWNHPKLSHHLFWSYLDVI